MKKHKTENPDIKLKYHECYGEGDYSGFEYYDEEDLDKTRKQTAEEIFLQLENYELVKEKKSKYIEIKKKYLGELK